MDMKEFAVPPWELSSECGCMDCRHCMSVFHQKAYMETKRFPYRRLRKEAILVAVTYGEKTTEPKASLEKTS